MNQHRGGREQSRLQFLPFYNDVDAEIPFCFRFKHHRLLAKTFLPSPTLTTISEYPLFFRPHTQKLVSIPFPEQLIAK
ncbi:hypothetical protein [Fervidibacillus albus]|uniref:Uncharacterized protein n=1 Tax=Fervidibacillus albus TaxID=2980026 RepID=A0A9E8LUH1_9BACI|nr:hypothetical protein [Fervidibacillus albus]WAA09727.1 hypothetical protein OE104_14625 [Fervidibacillus albus]